MAEDPRESSSLLLDFDGPTVSLVVGTETEQQRLLVHHSQLENASPVFKAAFKESWKEGQEAQITLPDDEPVTVKTYLHFIYTGKIACQTPDPVFTVPDSNRHLAEYIILAKLYCFGEKYQDVRLKNAIVNAIITKASVERFSPVGPSVDIIYKGTCAGSPARRPMIDMHIRSGHEHWLDYGVNNHEFLEDLTRELYRQAKQNGFTGGGRNLPNSDYYSS